MRRIATTLGVNCSQIIEGGVIYDPSYSYDHCGWKGAFYDYTTRCKAKPTSGSTLRFCPCVASLPPFDCEEGYHPLSTEWTSDKRRWCCRNTTFEFVGFGSAYEARTLCSGDGYTGLPMPKTALEKHMLEEVMHSALATGELGSDWPKNTIWLGAQWHEGDGTSRGRWMWDDHTPIAEKAVVENQLNAGTAAPFLCLLPGGAWHEALARYTFGVICEKPISQNVIPDRRLDVTMNFV
jgi:hypothetical protein